MIPKTIHYCWFGRKPLPRKAQKCIASWKKHCPDYEIIEWNEDNFDVYQTPYTRYCSDNQKWAFLSDYARLAVVYEHGGIYFDTDVEVIKNLDDLLNNEAFFGFETDSCVNTGLGFGAEAYSSAVKKMLLEYTDLPLEKWGVTGCPLLNTSALVKLGLRQDGTRQLIGNTVIYTKEVFNPYDDPTGILRKTDQTYSIHWYGKSWMSRKSIIRSTLSKPLHRLQYRLKKAKEK